MCDEIEEIILHLGLVRDDFHGVLRYIREPLSRSGDRIPLPKGQHSDPTSSVALAVADHEVKAGVRRRAVKGLHQARGSIKQLKRTLETLRRLYESTEPDPAPALEEHEA